MYSHKDLFIATPTLYPSSIDIQYSDSIRKSDLESDRKR